MIGEDELDYISSSADFAREPEVKTQDEVDLPALKRLAVLIEDKLRMYASIEALTTDETVLTVQQQLAVNKAITTNLQEIKALIDTVTADIKEKYKG